MSDPDITELKIAYYFGLQRARNMMPRIPRGEEGTRVLNVLHAMIDREMSSIENELPPGIIDKWEAS